ncbi:hypothetical protein GW17_00027593 [Ensete ventricosum]|nr:hypothetical protein GW17_00027593 [Ensete ventricosum]
MVHTESYRHTNTLYGKAYRQTGMYHPYRSFVKLLLGWIIAVPFILGTLYMFLVPCFKFLVKKFNSHPSSPMKLAHPHAEIKIKVRDV